MAKVSFSIATLENLTELVEMNEQLVIDEQFDVILSKVELTERMKDFILGNTYECYILLYDNQCCGYCLVDVTRKPLYLRHLFIKSNFRRMGFGSDTITQLLDMYKINDLDIEVMAWNTKAIAFYEKLGFSCRFLGMRINKKNLTNSKE